MPEHMHGDFGRFDGGRGGWGGGRGFERRGGYPLFGGGQGFGGFGLGGLGLGGLGSGYGGGGFGLGGLGSGLGGGLVGDLLSGGLGYLAGRNLGQNQQQQPGQYSQYQQPAPQYQQPQYQQSQYQQPAPQYQQPQYQQPAPQYQQPQYQQPPSQMSIGNTQNNELAQLKLLGQLREQGTLTEDEFQAEKQKILNG